MLPSMRVIALSTLKAFWERNPSRLGARDPALAWYRHTRKADWKSPAELKRDVGTASILKDGRVVFNIAGNKYRIVVWINYSYRVVYIRFIGTHVQYDRIDAQTI
jgi:mRNA interferase HigB